MDTICGKSVVLIIKDGINHIFVVGFWSIMASPYRFPSASFLHRKYPYAWCLKQAMFAGRALYRRSLLMWLGHGYFMVAHAARGTHLPSFCADEGC